LIHWANGGPGNSTVFVSGTGEAAQPPPASIEEILAYLDASFADGSLTGAGPGASAEHRQLQR